MSVLICGGAGYLGSHINKLLSEEGYDTIVFDNLSTGHKSLAKWGSLIVGDLTECNSINKAFKENNIDAVFHLAAYSCVGESVKNPYDYYRNNLLGTLNLLNAMRKYNCDKLIFSSSSAVYGIPDKMPITEETDIKPINPYGATKMMCERMIMDFSEAYGFRYSILRYFNASGADKDCEAGEIHVPETHIIPLVLDAATGKKEKFTIFGVDYPTEDGTCIRDYIHVCDIADANLKAYRYLKSGGENDIFNIGSENGISVLRIINSVRRISGGNFDVMISNRREGDPPILVGDSKKAHEILGWKQKYSEIDNIISDAWRWHCKLKEASQ